MTRRKASVRDAQHAHVMRLSEQGVGRNDIARLVGVSTGTVSRWVKDAGGEFTETRARQATAVAQATAAELRSRIALKFLVKADAFLDDLDQPFTAFNFGGKDNTYEEHELAKPPTGDVRNLVQSASIAVQRSLDLERADGDTASNERSLLAQLGASLGLTAETPL